MEMFDEETIDQIKNELRRRGETIAVAESVTTGMLQAAIGQADEAIYFFQGGITVYNLGQKARHLQIDPVYATTCNCVSERTAREMAEGVCRLFSSQWGISVTGYASAVPESDNEIFAWFAISHQGKTLHTERMEAGKYDKTVNVIMQYVNTILGRFLEVVEKEG